RTTSMRLGVPDMKPFAGHLRHAVYIDRLQKLCFDKRQTFRTSVRLPGSGINDVRRAVLMPACLENGERGERIHVQIREWILHRLDVAHVSCEIENIFLVAHEPAHE